MKKAVFVLIVCFTFTSNIASSQSMGLSFSYFIPKDGYFSTPISPFSIRGIGLDFTDFISLETGASLYRMSGMRIKDVPFESPEPFAGPFFSIYVPLQLKFNLYFSNQSLHFKGGGFGFYNFDTKLMDGNIDRALRDHLDWALVNSDFKVDNNLGVGWMAGAEYIIYLTDQFGINLEANYLAGDTKANLQGTYTGLPTDGSNIVTEEVIFPESAIDFTGWEFSVGLLFETGRR